MKILAGCLALGLTLNLFSAELAPLNERIAVSSTAAPDYIRDQPGGKGPRPESYVLAQGKYFESGTVDRSLDKITFASLVQKLVPDLAKQKYYPTKDEANANVLIVVHWGTSLIYDDPLKDSSMDALNKALPAYQAAVAATGMADPGDMNAVSDAMEWSQSNVRSAQARNAALMGYTQSLQSFGERNGYQSEKIKMLYSELSEERYLVVLMAYDYQALMKEKRSKLLWVTRLSVRSPGNNFTEALPVLSQAGGLVFGRQVDGLVHLKANLRQGNVAIGELKYLGVTEEPAVEEPKKQ